MGFNFYIKPVIPGGHPGQAALLPPDSIRLGILGTRAANQPFLPEQQDLSAQFWDQHQPPGQAQGQIQAPAHGQAQEPDQGQNLPNHVS